MTSPLTRRGQALRRPAPPTGPVPAPGRAGVSRGRSARRLRRGHHQLVVGEPVGGELVGDAGAADPADPDEALDQVVEAGRGVILDRATRASRTRAPSVLSESRGAGGTRCPRDRSTAGTAVVDDALGVGVGEPDARQRRVLERRAPVGDRPSSSASVTRSALDQGDELVAAASIHLRFRERLEVEPQQRLGVRGPHVEVPVSKSTEIPSRWETRPPWAA